METATIICPSCGQEYQVVPDDLDKCLLTYHCENCNSDFQVDFFDSCPSCHRPVGFLDSKALERIVSTIGKEIFNAVVNPASTLGAIKDIGSLYLNSKSGKFVNANGDGVCPICHKRYLRCGNCNELFSIDYDLSFKDTIKCPHCGITTSPDSINSEKGRFHSKEFNSLQLASQNNSISVEPTYSNNSQHNYQLPEKLPQNKTKLMEVIAYCDSNFSASYDTWSSIRSANQFLGNIKKYYKLNIPISLKDLAKKGASYEEIADYIIQHRTQLLSSNQDKTNDNNLQTLKVKNGLGEDIEVTVTDDPKGLRNLPFYMKVKDCFYIEGRGDVVTGKIEKGYVTLGEKISVNDNPKNTAVVVGIEIRQKLMQYAEFGDLVGLLLKDNGKINEGDILTKAQEIERRENLDDKKATDSSVNENNENEYLEELKACLADGELGGSERRLLNKLRIKLGISEERAAELEASLQKPQLTEEEQEYLEAYQDALEDGVVSEKERRLLDKLMKINNISEERAKEIEMLNK